MKELAILKNGKNGQVLNLEIDKIKNKGHGGVLDHSPNPFMPNNINIL